ncbi:MAG: DNA primase [Betaproteobacteria bacterium]
MTAPIDLVLSRLEKVRKRQSGQWSARCPAHRDRNASLSVREAPNGAVLIHCFAGCAIEEISGAMELQISELFPPRERSGREPQRIAKVLTAGQALEILNGEILFAATASANLAKGLGLSNADHQRLMVCASRVGAIAKEVVQ